MGRHVAEGASTFEDIQVIAGVDLLGKTYAAFPVYEQFSSVLEQADMIIDFSLPAALPQIACYLREKKIPAVLCATGYSEQDEEVVRTLSRDVPIFRSDNMSLGVFVLKYIAATAKKMLPSFDIEIIEKHHTRKVDAPSGTALAIYEGLATGENHPAYGRNPGSGKRQKEEIGLHSVRGGTVVGEHDVGFYGTHETLRIVHSAQDRAVFASGALNAAQFLLHQKPGLYGMKDYFASLLSHAEQA